MRAGRLTCIGLTAAVLASPGPVAAEPLDRVRSATVYIESIYRPLEKLRPTGRDLFPVSGTGFVVADEGLIVTNAHVVRTVREIDLKTGKRSTDTTPFKQRIVYVLHAVSVRFHSGTKKSFTLPASVLGTFERPHVDLALLRVYPNQKQLVAAELQSNDDLSKLKQGHKVWSVGFPKSINFGNPNGPEIVVHKGEVAALNRGSKGKVRAINHDAKVDHGNSGGPLVDEKGRVVGINTFLISKQDFAIPVTTLREEFAGTLKHRTVPIAKRRVLTVGTGPKAKFKTVNEAMKAAKPGDTVLLDAGRHEMTSPLWVGQGVCLRGAGSDRTQLVLKYLKSGFSFVHVEADRKESSSYREISDMTIETSGANFACLSIESAPRESFIHDLVLKANKDCSHALVIGAGSHGAPSIVNCRILHSGHPRESVIVYDRAGKPQFHRVEIPGVTIAERRRTNGGITVNSSGQGSPLFSGCVFLPVKRVKGRAMSENRILAYGTPTFVGCHFARGSAADRVAHEMTLSGGVLRSSVFFFPARPTVPFLQLWGPGIRIIGNKFVAVGKRSKLPKAITDTSPDRWMDEIAITISVNDSPTISHNLFVGCRIKTDTRIRKTRFPGPPAYGNHYDGRVVE